MKWIDRLNAIEISDSVAAFGVFLTIVISMLGVALLLKSTWREFAFLILGGILGGLLGWLVGILVSPYSGEEEQFTKLTTTITSFVTGYLASRLGSGWRMFIDSKSYTNPLYLERIGFGFCGFLLAILLTFITRKYANIGLVIKPENVELKPGDNQQFEARLQSLTIQDLTWFLEPELGTIDQDGTYHAPSSINGRSSVKVIAVAPRQPNARAVANISLG